MEERDFVIFFVGILTCQMLVRILKPLIGHLRPIPTTYKGKYGMPSGRATLMMFIATYFALKTENQSITILLYAIALTSIVVKYISKEHSLFQLLAGSVLGACLAYLFERL